MLSLDICEAARLTRDPRFDGEFYYGVTTTGVFCRPVCSARQALAKNVTYFDSAKSAKDAGFRACKRCKPEGRKST